MSHNRIRALAATADFKAAWHAAICADDLSGATLDLVCVLFASGQAQKEHTLGKNPRPA